MDVDQLISRAWAAVEGAGVPEPLHEIAFKEAIDFLREDAAPDAPEERDSKRKQTRSRREPKPGDGAKKDARQPTDQATFWERLAHESGIEESVLRDVLQFNGTDVHVTPPTRNLGSNVAEQAKTVISLVAGARGIGLDEQPVSAPAVREELQRKRWRMSGSSWNFGGDPRR